MSNRRPGSVDAYFRREDSALAKGLRRIAPGSGVRYLNSWQKDVIERVIVLPAAAVAAPVSALLALAVRVTEGGSGWYRQERNWGPNKRMTIVKIRTMTEGSDVGVVQYHDTILKQGDHGDVRITPLGRVLRRFELDELPQFVQILLGQMALTGLRPVYDELVTEKREGRPKSFPTWYRGYAGSKLGLLSMSSVLLTDGQRKDVVKRIHYDIFYIKRANLGIDLYLTYRVMMKLWDKLLGKSEPEPTPTPTPIAAEPSYEEVRELVSVK